MRVCVKSPVPLSIAMNRIARALATYAPERVTIVRRPEDADLQIMHVIGPDAIDYRSPAEEVAVIQYCMGNWADDWSSLWRRALTIWSYYDLRGVIPSGANFYHAPLGIDPEFLKPVGNAVRDIGVVTSGYVAGPGAEAIEEIAWAAHTVGLTTVHIGPMPVGLTRDLPSSWSNVRDITDAQLADIYRRARWVSGLRFVEGFEMPVIEGMACGARPVVFDRRDMRQWYDGYAEFVPENSRLLDTLIALFDEAPRPVSAEERATFTERFRWEPIIDGFWDTTLQCVGTN